MKTSKVTKFGFAVIMVASVAIDAAAQITTTVQTAVEMTSTSQTTDHVSSSTESAAETTGTINSGGPPAATPTATPAPKSVTTSTATATQNTATSVTLPNGIIYQVLRPGTGRQADTTSTRLIHYTLSLPNGKKLESSRDRQLPVPFSFTPGASEAIVGMQKGTDSMRIGEIRKLYIPSELAYGANTHGVIPPNSDLVFELELVDLKKPVIRDEAPSAPPPGAAAGPGAANTSEADSGP